MWIHEICLEFDKEDGNGRVIAGKSKKSLNSEEVDWSVDADGDYTIRHITTDCNDLSFRESLKRHIKAMRLKNLF